MALISFSYQKPFYAPKQKTRLKQFLVELAGAEGYGIDVLSIVFCSDAFLRKMNREYLGHDYETDILTFELGERSGLITGELYISIDRVRENAEQWSQPMVRELHRVIFHGLLHLCGYKDTLKAQQARMREKEDFYLRRYLGA